MAKLHSEHFETPIQNYSSPDTYVTNIGKLEKKTQPPFLRIIIGFS